MIVKLAQQLPSGHWRAVIRRKSLGTHSAVFPTREAALRWRAEKLAALYKAKSATSTAPALKDVVAEYLLSVRYLRKAPGTQTREKCAVAPLLFVGGRKGGNPRPWSEHPVDIIDGLDIQNYIDTRTREPCQRNTGKTVSPDSVRLEVRLLSCVFKHAVQRRYRQGNPALARHSGFDLPPSNVRDTRISSVDEFHLYDHAYGRICDSRRANAALYPWLKFVGATGCRPGEAARIELAWYNVEARHIDIPRRGTKKRNPRRVLITEALAAELQAQFDRAISAGSKYLFFSKSRKSGEPIPFQYSTGWRAVRKLAGVTSEAHGMRRELISRLFESSGLTDGQIALIVGDVNVMSLEPYKHLRATELRAQYDAFQQAQDVLRARVQLRHTMEQFKVTRIEDIPLEVLATLDVTVPQEMRTSLDPATSREVSRKQIALWRKQAREQERLDAQPLREASKKKRNR
jgi:integrase